MSAPLWQTRCLPSRSFGDQSCCRRLRLVCCLLALEFLPRLIPGLLRLSRGFRLLKRVRKILVVDHVSGRLQPRRISSEVAAGQQEGKRKQSTQHRFLRGSLREEINGGAPFLRADGAPG